MRVLNLQIENIKKIVAVDITPDKHVVKITGKNAQGKTSILDSIWWAMGGKNAAQSEPVRHGQTHGSIRMNLGELQIERRFTPKSSTLHVYNRSGEKVTSPQKVLNQLLGRLSFDPLGFRSLGKADQLAYLRNLVGLDFTDLNAKRETVFVTRTDAKRALADLESRKNAITVHEDTPDELIDIGQLLEKLQGIHKNNNLREKKKTDLDDIFAQVKNLDRKAEEIKAKIRSLHEQKDAIELSKKELVDRQCFLADELQGYAHINAEATEKLIANAERFNGYWSDRDARDILNTRILRGQGIIEGMTSQLNAIDEDKRQQLEAAQFPISGLGFNESSVTFNGIPFDQASFSQQLTISVSMAMAINPTLKVIRIAEGSTLDNDSMALLEKIAVDNDFQIWIEIVDDSGQVGVYIEDGEVKNAETTPADNDEKGDV